MSRASRLPRSAAVGALLALLAALLLPGSTPSTSRAAGGDPAPRPDTTALITDAVSGGPWRGSWAAGLVSPPDPSDVELAGRTVRMVVHLSVGGTAVRLRVANTFGPLPVTFASVRVGPAAPGGAVRSGANHQVTFGGAPSVTVPAGERVRSDPVDLTTWAGSDLAVSLHIPASGAGPASWHPNARATTYLSDPGDHAGEESGASYTPWNYSWHFLDGVDVRSQARGMIVAFGDSITDGAASSVDADRRYPDRLAFRLAETGIDLSVVNTGIGGNRLLTGGMHHGQSALDRFERDVLAQTGVTHVIVLLGVNDIGFDPQITPGRLIAGHRELIRRAHARGVRIYGGTLLPYQGAAYHTARGERTRQAFNRWIRTSGEYDAVIDFDAAIRDPAAPGRMLPAYDSGDHLHPSDAGYQAMADAVDPELFGVAAAEVSRGPAGAR